MHPKTGAAVLAIERSGSNLSEVHRGLHLEAGDVVALVGTTEAIEDARRLLTGESTATDDSGKASRSAADQPHDQRDDSHEGTEVDQ